MKERKPLGEEKERQLLEFVRYNSLDKTAKQFGIGVDKVRDILKKHGYKRTEEDRRRLISKSTSRILTKEEETNLISYYQTHSLEETANEFNYSEDWVQHFLKDKGLTRKGEDKYNFIANTRKKHTRDKFPINDGEIIDFYSKTNTKDTCDKFHIDLNLLYEICNRNNFPIRDKKGSSQLRFKTNLEKYGVESPLQNENLYKKKTQTTLNKYGVDHISKVPEIRAKAAKTCLNLYGDEVPSKTQLIKDKVASTNLSRLGVTSPMKNPRIRKIQAQHAIKSKLEKRVEEFLINNNFKYEHHPTIKLNSLIHAFDFAIFKDNKLEILIDCDGEYYHGYITDIDGKHVNCDVDEYRSTLVPEGVKFLIILEGQEEEAYREIFKLYNQSYDEYLNSIFNWCREVEFPYSHYNDKILNNSYKSLLKSDINKFTMKARYGDKIIYNFHPSIWKAKRGNNLSPHEAWNKDELLLKCIKNRIIYKGCNLDRSKVLAGLTISGIAPKISIFNSYLTKYLIETYMPESEIIFDPCSGYSGRMLGTCASGREYIGQDINPITVEESNKIINYFNLSASIKCKSLLEDEGEYDYLFTCPPYGNKENWGQEIEDKSCDEWVDEILKRYKCKKYLFVVDRTNKYNEYVVEELINKSHFGDNKELVILISLEGI